MGAIVGIGGWVNPYPLIPGTSFLAQGHLNDIKATPLYPVRSADKGRELANGLFCMPGLARYLINWRNKAEILRTLGIVAAKKICGYDTETELPFLCLARGAKTLRGATAQGHFDTLLATDDETTRSHRLIALSSLGHHTRKNYIRLAEQEKLDLRTLSATERGLYKIVLNEKPGAKNPRVHKALPLLEEHFHSAHVLYDLYTKLANKGDKYKHRARTVGNTLVRVMMRDPARYTDFLVRHRTFSAESGVQLVEPLLTLRNTLSSDHQHDLDFLANMAQVFCSGILTESQAAKIAEDIRAIDEERAINFCNKLLGEIEIEAFTSQHTNAARVLYQLGSRGREAHFRIMRDLASTITPSSAHFPAARYIVDALIEHGGSDAVASLAHALGYSEQLDRRILQGIAGRATREWDLQPVWDYVDISARIPLPEAYGDTSPLTIVCGLRFAAPAHQEELSRHLRIHALDINDLINRTPHESRLVIVETLARHAGTHSWAADQLAYVLEVIVSRIEDWRPYYHDDSAVLLAILSSLSTNPSGADVWNNTELVNQVDTLLRNNGIPDHFKLAAAQCVQRIPHRDFHESLRPLVQITYSERAPEYEETEREAELEQRTIDLRLAACRALNAVERLG